MNTLLSVRLANQLLTDENAISSPHTTPYEVVKHMTCLQSQDFKQSKRAIASRIPTWCTEEDIHQAYNDGLIVRTRTQRGTIHTVATEDAGRIVKLCAAKTLSGFKKRRAYLGMSDEIAELALDTLRRVLNGNKALPRDQIAQHFSEAGIVMQTGWNYHLLCYAGSLGLIVQWPIIDGEPAFVLYDKRASTKNNYSDSDAVRELSLRYFWSHGPATIDDFARRTGLGKTEIKKGIVECGENLQAQEIERKTYYCRDVFLARPLDGDHHQRDTNQYRNAKSISLHDGTGIFLAWFDEFLLGYKDRTATLELDHHRLVDVSRNGVFRPTVMLDGKTVATRSVKHKSKISEITVTPFQTLDSKDILLLKKASQKYAYYSAKEISLCIV